MRTRLALLAAASTVAGMAMASAPARAQMPWEPTVEAAMTKARTTGKLLMVDFYTDW